MKTTLFSLSALTATVLGQTVTQSAPFNLITVSDNKTVDGIALTACHSGAAIETFCTYKTDNATQYYFNVTTYEGNTQPIPAGGQTGVLAYDLPSTPVIPSTMQLSANVASNVAVPVLFPGNELVTYVAFDGNDYMNIQSSIDDTVSPPNATGPVTAYYRWYICETYFGGYNYQTLAWVYGNGVPENPSCVKTDIKRVFV